MDGYCLTETFETYKSCSLQRWDKKNAVVSQIYYIFCIIDTSEMVVTALKDSY